ncbi:hypothetical protein TDB9533_02938 [Thalassocella blandensis]|nr:hypothetical protein TDB9533_02938 [Thalassocella blandensis]
MKKMSAFFIQRKLFCFVIFIRAGNAPCFSLYPGFHFLFLILFLFLLAFQLLLLFLFLLLLLLHPDDVLLHLLFITFPYHSSLKFSSRLSYLFPPFHSFFSLLLFTSSFHTLFSSPSIFHYFFNNTFYVVLKIYFLSPNKLN